jgi:hypothetical protein
MGLSRPRSDEDALAALLAFMAAAAAHGTRIWHGLSVPVGARQGCSVPAGRESNRGPKLTAELNVEHHQEPG